MFLAILTVNVLTVKVEIDLSNYATKTDSAATRPTPPPLKLSKIKN